MKDTICLPTYLLYTIHPICHRKIFKTNSKGGITISDTEKMVSLKSEKICTTLC